MKKNSGKKTRKAPARSTATKAKTTSDAAPARTGEIATPTPSPFAETAASPLSKETPAVKTSGGKSRPPELTASQSVQPEKKSEVKTPAAAKEATHPITIKQERSPISQSKSLEQKSPILPARPTSSSSTTLQAELGKAPNEVTKSSAKPGKPGKRPARPAEAAQSEIKIPSLLLEGDLPPSPSVSGPGARYALAPQPLVAPPMGGGGELPEAYGTGRVFLAARDPHWLYVSWDFTAAQQIRYNSRSRDGHLVIKIFAGDERQPAVPDVHVHPESKDWFVHVPRAETAYRAEIGYYDKNANWENLAVSQKSFTPPDAPSTDVSAKFATIPVDVTFQQVVEAVQQFVTISKNEPLLEAVAHAAEAQRNNQTAPATSIKEPKLPRTSVTRIGPVPDPKRSSKSTRNGPSHSLPIEITPGGAWTVEQTRALTKLIHIDSFRRVWLGSMEITELVRLQLQEEMSSIAAAEARRAIRGEKLPAGPFELNVSSPVGGDFGKPGKFWFKINAELIIYGATEPDATVTIADRVIKLRPDGTFSFRFSLPDGRYQLPTAAVASSGNERREARLEFSRSTEYHGHVEAHAQDAKLRPPQRDNVS
jgi:uncharacterized protein